MIEILHHASRTLATLLPPDDGLLAWLRVRIRISFLSIKFRRF